MCDMFVRYSYSLTENVFPGICVSIWAVRILDVLYCLPQIVQANGRSPESRVDGEKKLKKNNTKLN